MRLPHRRAASLTFVRVLAGALAAGWLTACGGGDGGAGPTPPPPTPTVRSVAVTPAAATLRVGDTQALSAIVDAVNGAGTGVTWSSESPSVATVNASGVVTAVAPGTATVRATSSADTRVSGTAQITVQVARSITITPAAVSVGTGQTATLTAAVQVEAGRPTTVRWRTSAASIATVSATGVVTGVALGNATITAIADADSLLTATAAVTVVPSVRAVSVSPTAASLFIGGTQQLTATVTADAGASQAVTWRSATPTVATVSATGLVTAVGVGSAQVTVLATADTTRRATATITVTPRPVSVSITQRAVSLNVGSTVPLTAVVSADPGVSTAVTWTTANSTIATVSAQGVVSGVANGSTLITATSVADATKRDTVTVNVVPRLASLWTPSRLSGPLYEDIVALTVADATTAFAVNALGDIYRWSGTAWVQSATGASFGTTFYAIHGTSATSIIAVGTNGIIVRWNGTTWIGMPSGTTRALYAVWVESATSAWVVGDNGTALRLAGTQWVSEATGTTNALNSVWSGDNVVYAVGNNGEVTRRTITGWSSLTVPTAEPLYAVHGLTQNDVVVGGSAGTLLRFDGTNWTQLGVGGFTGSIFAITGSFANSGRRMLVGDGGVAQLDQTAVSLVTTPYAPRLFAAVLDGTGTTWVGGQRGLVMRSGTPWTTLNLAPDLLDVWTVNATNAWAVGEFGSIYRWNGSTWTRQAVSTTEALQTVWAASANDVFVGGDNGTMLRFNGTTWSTMSLPTTASVYAMWGSGSTNVLATTDAGEVLRFNGTAWSVLTTATQPLWAIWGVSPTDVVVVGENNLAMRWNGTTWTTLPAINTAPGTLAGVWMTSSTDVFAVGANVSGLAGVAYAFNGTTWSSQVPPSTRVLTGIWGPGTLELYATGDGGTLLRYNGSTWGSVATGTTDLLWSVSGAANASGGAFAVGYNSTILAGSGGGVRAALRVDAPASGSLDPRSGARVVRRALPAGVARRTRR
ncbi:MAG: Ig-like domain-containing protein [Gemmatimonadetes bacterium]|nr:Ig-like domain-containing protein [Gemmatimonadota bacterium]